MDTSEKYQYTNQGYSLALVLPIEFRNPIKTKMIDLSENSNDKDRWKALTKGFEMGLKEKTNNRLQELGKVTKSREISQGRTR